MGSAESHRHGSSDVLITNQCSDLHLGIGCYKVSPELHTVGLPARSAHFGLPSCQSISVALD